MINIFRHLQHCRSPSKPNPSASPQHTRRGSRCGGGLPPQLSFVWPPPTGSGVKDMSYVLLDLFTSVLTAGQGSHTQRRGDLNTHLFVPGSQPLTENPFLIYPPGTVLKTLLFKMNHIKNFFSIFLFPVSLLIN